jgi:hypothetical protein
VQYLKLCVGDGGNITKTLGRPLRFRPCGAMGALSQGLRPGLYSFTASRLQCTEAELTTNGRGLIAESVPGAARIEGLDLECQD